MSIKSTIYAVKQALSSERLTTYEVAAAIKNDSDPAALDLYLWNARVAAAFLVPLHICEVVTRNSASDALALVYGVRWPWSTAFERSLPNQKFGYNPRLDLQLARGKYLTTGKVIPELKFYFWQNLFTSRHDARLWAPNWVHVFPHADRHVAVSVQRKKIYDHLEQIRRLRNRIAHHEPIFQRNLTGDLSLIAGLIGLRCKVTSAWMLANQEVTQLLGQRP